MKEGEGQMERDEGEKRERESKKGLSNNFNNIINHFKKPKLLNQH